MKKNSLAFLAVTIAIAASAFTMRPAAHNSKKMATLYYWNFMSGTIGAYEGSFTSHANAKAATHCPDIQVHDCSRGYTQSQLTNPLLPGSPSNPPAAANVNSPLDQLLKQ